MCKTCNLCREMHRDNLPQGNQSKVSAMAMLLLGHQCRRNLIIAHNHNNNCNNKNNNNSTINKDEKEKCEKNC